MIRLTVFYHKVYPLDYINVDTLELCNVAVIVAISIFHDYSMPFYLACDPNPCNNGGTCANTDGTAECTCAGGFTGDRCDTGKLQYK